MKQHARSVKTNSSGRSGAEIGRVIRITVLSGDIRRSTGYLEREASPHLYDSSIAVVACGTGDCARRRVSQRASARIPDIRIRVGEVDVIKRIVGVRPDIQFDAFPVKKESLS